MSRVVVRFCRVRKNAWIPKRMSLGAAGHDVFAALEAAIEVRPLERVRVPTGLAVSVPAGFEVQIRPRSGLAWKHGLTILNAPGTIDSDYRGEVQVLLINLGQEPVVIHDGDRIAQMLISQSVSIHFEEGVLDQSDRNIGGFGSTG